MCMYFPLFVGVLCLSLLFNALICVHLSFAIRCTDTINVLWLFLMVPWVGLQFVIVVLPDHTRFLKT